MKMRLQKILAQSTNLSRRAAEEVIKDGLVRVNGTVVTRMGSQADPERDRITLSGKPIKQVRQKIYILFNKPRNVIVSKRDPEGRPLIWDYLPPDMKDILNSAGRLDFDSEGLMLLTNDGNIIYRLTHPSCEIWKTYLVKISGVPNEAAVAKLAGGVKLEEGVTGAARVTVIKKAEKNATLEISIKEGRNRQVRRMLDGVGYPVIRLRRMAIGHLKLGSLKPGRWRVLNKREIGFVKVLGKAGTNVR